jgi:nitroreductase
LRAPLLVAIVFSPRPNPKVPDWEQLAATTMVVYNLTLLLHGSGWGTMWRTGAPSRAERVHRLHGLADGEQLLGWLYVGTPDESVRLPARPSLDVRTKIGALTADGAVIALGAAVAHAGNRS